jgi:hypothetical protein
VGPATSNRYGITVLLLTALLVESPSNPTPSESSTQQSGSQTQQATPSKQQVSANVAKLSTNVSPSGTEPAHTTPPPKFRLFKFKADVPTSYVVPVNTTDEELKSLLWLFRQSVRTDNFKRIGITQPTSKQFGQLGYTSGMLVIFRGEKCANEDYISDADIDRGRLGPCGYGEHDDAYYQWGIDADRNKDDAGIRDENGNSIPVFDYEDNWHPPSEAPEVVGQQVQQQWKSKQQQWEAMQRYAVQITNGLAQEGLNVEASANENEPKELDFHSQRFTNSDFRGAFMKNALPKVNRNLCDLGFGSVRLLTDGDASTAQTYPLHCPK